MTDKDFYEIILTLQKLLTFAVDFVSKKKYQKNVLYCGMADDILTPLLLCPDLTTLYVIDFFDSAYSPTGEFQGQKEEILLKLLKGSNEGSHHRSIALSYNDSTPVTKLYGDSLILSSKDDNNAWRVKFLYDGFVRDLVYFHHRDFREKWPDEIKNISHLMSMGAVFDIGNSFIYQSIKERCIDSLIYYCLQSHLGIVNSGFESKEFKKFRNSPVYIYRDFISQIDSIHGTK